MRIIVSSYISFVVFFGLSFIFGDQGLIAIQRLKVYKTALEQNIGELQEYLYQYQCITTTLQADREVLTLYARDLGLYNPGEGQIRLDRPSVRNSFFTPGKLLNRKPVTATNRAFFRGVSISVGMLVLILLSIPSASGLKNAARKKDKH